MGGVMLQCVNHPSITRYTHPLAVNHKSDAPPSQTTDAALSAEFPGGV